MRRAHEKHALRVKNGAKSLGKISTNIISCTLLSLGYQWTPEEEDDMIKSFRKVPLASNKLGSMSNALLGEQQQNTPQLKLFP